MDMDGIIPESIQYGMTLGWAKMTKIYYLTYCHDLYSILMIYMTTWGHIWQL